MLSGMNPEGPSMASHQNMLLHQQQHQQAVQQPWQQASGSQNAHTSAENEQTRDVTMSGTHPPHGGTKQQRRVSWAPGKHNSAKMPTSASHSPTTTSAQASSTDKTSHPPPQPTSIKQEPPATPDIPFPPRPRMQSTSEQYGIQKKSSGEGLQKQTAIPGFFPWTGKHAEDKLTDSLIKTGYVDKQQLAMESHTARSHPLAPQLKQKTCLKALSSLFVAVLEQRQQRGLVTAPSTFKPPPRVTLTDAKREAWLRDLADDSVPLRRLSRTIPHGIKGKVLLHQCLAKSVPMPRAVWLSKCVGANEIRAFRRKGVSEATAQEHEVKWVKEWTTIVSSFIEECVDKCGKPDGKPAVQYTLRLLLRLYAEDLMDRPQLLDWLLRRFEICNLNDLPIFLLLIRMFWSELLQGYKNGSRLARAFVNKLAELLDTPHKDIFLPLKQRLAEATYTLAANRPQCFLNAQEWKKTERVLSTLSTGVKAPLSTVIASIISRNARIGRAAARDGVTATSHKRRLVDLLDSRGLAMPDAGLLSQLLALCPNIDKLVLILLQWATTAFRHDDSRPYVAVRLIQELQSQVVDINLTMLEALEQLRQEQNLQPRLLAQILNQLIQAKALDAGAYMRRLMSTGALHNSRQGQPSWDAKVLVNLDLTYSSPSVSALRRTLLRSAGFTVEDEVKAADDVKQHVKQVWSNWTLMTPDFPAQETRLKSLSSLPLPVNSLVSHWILDTSKSLLIVEPMQSEDPTNIGAASYSIAVGHFLWICSLFEQLEAFSSLAAFIDCAAQTCDAELVSVIVSILELHLEVFVAIGAATNILETVVSRYRSLRATMPPTRDCAQTLQRIATLLRAPAGTLNYLANEIFLCNQGLGIAAFTPESDSGIEMAGIVPSADVDDDLERLLSSSTTMDNDSFVAAFDKIMSKLAAMDHMNEAQSNSVKVLLGRLRSSVEQEKMKSLAAQWIRTKIANSDDAGLAPYICALVDHGCITLPDFLDVANKMHESLSEENANMARNLAAEVLAILVGYKREDGNSTTSNVRYVYELERRKYCQDNRRTLLRFLHRSLDARQTENATESHVEAIWESRAFLSTMQKYILSDASLVASEFDFNAVANAPHARKLVHCLSDPMRDQRLLDTPIVDAIKQILSGTDVFSVYSSLFALRLLFASSMSTSDDPAAAAKIMSRTLEVLLSLDDCLTNELVSGFGKDIADQLQGLLEQTLVAKDPPNERLRARLHADPANELIKYRGLIDATASSSSNQSGTKIAQRVLELLDALCHRFDPASAADTSSVATPWSNDSSDNVIQLWISTLLHLAVIHTEDFHPDVSDKSSTAKLVSVLCTLLINGVLRLPPEILEYIFDTTAYFLTDLSTAAISNIRASLQPRVIRSPAIRFLLDYREPRDSSLCLTRPPALPAKQPSLSNPETNQDSAAPSGPPPAKPFHLRPWELFPDSTPNAGANDTALNLRLFRARVA